jgi:integrase
MAKKLTSIAIANLRPGPQRREISDGGSGLFYVLQPSGRSSWASRYRFRGRPKKLTHDGPLTLAAARKAHADAMLELAQKRDPAALKSAAKIAAADRGRADDTIERLFHLFLTDAKRKTRPATWGQCESIFRREVLPKWRGRLVTDIARKDVRELIRSIARTRPIAANRAQSYLSRFFRWLLNENYIAASPAVAIERPAKENVRDRVLDDGEVRAFWSGTDALPAPFGDVYKLLLLSAARRQEVGEMRWGEVNLANREWTIPSKRAKGKLAVVLPLGPVAWSIIERQPRIVGSDLVFGQRCSGFSYMKAKLDAIMKPAVSWVNHDLRRTARSLMSRARVPSDVAELCLGHVLPGTVRRIYDRFEYLAEKRGAFEALEREIDRIIHPSEADVITFRR